MATRNEETQRFSSTFHRKCFFVLVVANNIAGSSKRKLEQYIYITRKLRKLAFVVRVIGVMILPTILFLEHCMICKNDYNKPYDVLANFEKHWLKASKPHGIKKVKISYNDALQKAGKNFIC
ncbi:Phospholipase D beta 1, partial [Mucuna pruriens]